MKRKEKFTVIQCSKTSNVQIIFIQLNSLDNIQSTTGKWNEFDK